jgi:hypothetical protein
MMEIHPDKDRLNQIEQKGRTPERKRIHTGKTGASPFRIEVI